MGLVGSRHRPLRGRRVNTNGVVGLGPPALGTPRPGDPAASHQELRYKLSASADHRHAH